ncbi:MAG: plasma-membrane proton-efflux P-type ATPase [Dehalococcoidia bacterium]
MKGGQGPNKEDLSGLTIAGLMSRLGVSKDGLSKKEAGERLLRFGYNELPEKKVNPVLKFLSYFWGPMPWMIEVAAILSAILRHLSDLGIILALLLMNSIVGFREEHEAGNAVAALKSKLALKARVKRDGSWTALPARELVPGDLIHLRIGDIVPADAKLLEGDPVEIDQSALTGESLPVERKLGESIYSGSILRQGEVDALVHGTGKSTFFGKTVELVETAETHSHFQQAVLKIANYLIFIAIGLAVLIVAVALFRGDVFLQVLQFALVLTIASVPVALPAVLSVTMAVGAGVLAQKQAVVTRLAAVEELAGINVLCSDKTGTLTQNKLTAGEPFTVSGFTAEDIFLSAGLASREESGDTIDLAILGKVGNLEQIHSYKVTHFLPFDPVHKRTEATVADNSGHEFKTTKGAPQVILALDASADKILQAANSAVDGFAVKGYRSLGVAHTDKSGNWQFQGIIPLFDPLREDSKATVKAARELGIDFKMVTGDQVAIAREIGKQLDLGKDVVDATLFDETKQNAGQMADAIERADIFAQVFPEHKYHIVDVLQQRHRIVGMTGDGVNDAPALKKADAGIAVAGSTDAARAAADIILLSPGLSVIIDAIREARKIFQRMTNYAIYRISETIRVLLFMTLAIVVFNFYPVTAIMIILLAILNDGAILTIAYDNVKYSNKPEAWDMKFVLGLATILGIYGVLSSFGLFYLLEQVFHLSRDLIQSLIYLKLSVAGHLTVFVARTKGPFWSIRPANVLIIAVVLTQIVATLIAVYGLFMAPAGWGWAGFVWGYALVAFIIQDRVKLLAEKILSAK